METVIQQNSSTSLTGFLLWFLGAKATRQFPLRPYCPHHNCDQADGTGFSPLMTDLDRPFPSHAARDCDGTAGGFSLCFRSLRTMLPASAPPPAAAVRKKIMARPG